MKMRISSLLSGFLGLTLTASFASFIIILAITLRTDALNELNSKFLSILQLNEGIFKNTLDRKSSLTAALSEDFMIIKAFVDLKSGFDSSDKETLEKIYKAKVKDRSKITMGDGVEMYEFMHEAHHTQITKYMNTSFFTDLLLVDIDGLIFYSYRKQDEFGNKIDRVVSQNPRIAKLQTILTKLNKSKQTGMAIFQDESGSGIISASPVFIKKKISGYVVTVMPFSYFGQQFSDAGVMGQTGAILLANQDKQLLTWSSQNRLKFKNWKLDNSLLSTRDSKKRTVKKIEQNGVVLHSVLKQMKIEGHRFNLLLQQQDDEIFAHTYRLQITLALTGGIILLIALVIVMLALRKVSTPLAKVTTELEKVASGHADEVEGIETQLLEIRKISDALKVFRDSVVEKEELKISAVEVKNKEQEKQEELASLILQFREVMAHSLKSITDKSSEMKSSADSLLNVSKETTDKAQSAHLASQNASGNVSVVAASAVQLSGSIQEVAAQTKKANQLISSANEAAESTNECVAELSEATGEIGQVLEVISRVAQKTNLLALNATIEAVHAGEAGKSFAIVAEEVRQLSEETTQAIGNIDKQIKSVKDSANYAVGLIKMISHSVVEITEVANTIGTAVVTQTNATGEISDKMVSTAEESTTVTENVESVSRSIEQTAEMAKQVIGVSDQFTKLAGRLSVMAESFIADVEQDLEERRAQLQDTA